MIKIENTDIFGWSAAIRGARNPMNSWEKSDSYWTHIENPQTENTANFEFFVGDNDLDLMKRLSKSGNDHAKFLRMIHVQCDVTAPLYWWKEADTYKVGTVRNSCSTMHKVHSKEFTMDDFSAEHLMHDDEGDFGIGNPESPIFVTWFTIRTLNYCREKFIETKDKKWWWQLIQMLPASYNQKSTLDLNYQVLKSMYFARRNHKLDEWHDFCDWCLTLPYFKEICVDPVEGDIAE